MCTGVTSGFAGMKLSGSLKIYGSVSDRFDKIMIVMMNPVMSFAEK
jgi:hypothetical protein